MNNRHQRNLLNISAIEEKIKRLNEELLNVTLSEDIENISLEINDYNSDIERLKLSFKELVEESKNDLKQLYLNDEVGDWSIAWSGGKDSTTVAGLVIDMLTNLSPDQRKRHVHFIMSDTMVENPNLESYMHSQVKKLKGFVDKSDLPITVHLAQRLVEHSYFYLILGRGYFLPQNNGRGRWCTQRLKLFPQYKVLEEVSPIYQLTGVRLSESQRRKASIQKWTLDESISRKIGENHKTKTFMPIVDFTIEDVWEYLQRERLPWTSTHDVRTLYKEATGECGFSNPKGVEAKASQSESCGARFGCWVCPVILKDKSTEAMSKFNDWMQPLSRYRMLQLITAGDYIPIKLEGQKRKERSRVIREAKEIGAQIKMITKSGHKRNGKKYTDKEGVVHNDKGTVTVETRKFMFSKLIETENEVNYIRVKNGLDKISLISDEEIARIKLNWKEDEEKCPWLTTNVNGIKIEELSILIEKMYDLERNQTIEFQEECK